MLALSWLLTRSCPIAHTLFNGLLHRTTPPSLLTTTRSDQIRSDLDVSRNSVFAENFSAGCRPGRAKNISVAKTTIPGQVSLDMKQQQQQRAGGMGW